MAEDEAAQSSSPAILVLADFLSLLKVDNIK